MANYAFLNINNIVVEVIVGKDESNFDWERYYGDIRGEVCKRTSYNTRGGIYYNPITNMPDENQSKAFRKNFAGLDYSYSWERDAFIPPKPYPSWVLDDFSCLWEPPIPYPTDGKNYVWNEQTQSWVLES
jgi:hypothetical protein